VHSFTWNNGALQYDLPFTQPLAQGFDYNHIDVSTIQLAIDSVYFSAPNLSLKVQTAAMRELNSHELGFWNKQFALARDQGIIVRTFNRNNKCVWALPMSQQMQPTLFDGTDTVSADAPPF
jgi:hypothetical protein